MTLTSNYKIQLLLFFLEQVHISGVTVRAYKVDMGSSIVFSQGRIRVECEKKKKKRVSEIVT